MLKRFFGTPKPTVPSGQRVYAIGDVHGRLDLLEALLNRIERDNASRDIADVTLILLGDLIDRGTRSRDVVAKVRAGVAWARTIALMGNHESIMLDSLDGKRSELERWLKFGGRQTLESWGVKPIIFDFGTLDDILFEARSVISSDDRKWLSQLRRNLRIGDYYFVHAGVRPGVPLEHQTADDCLWIRNDFLDSRRKHGAVIVHGHSIQADVEERPNRIGLDTGAYYTGLLTAVGIEGSERWFLSTRQQ